MAKTILEDSAKIQELITGADGQTRGAILQLANKAGTLRRTVQLLYPLGVSQSVTQEDTADEIEPEEERSETPGRPQRRAAARGRDRVRAQSKQIMIVINCVSSQLGECLELWTMNYTLWTLNYIFMILLGHVIRHVFVRFTVIHEAL